MDHRAIAKIASDPASVKTEAVRMRQALSQLTVWQERFLSGLEKDGILESRFWEAFNYLRSKASVKTVVGGYRACDLLRQVYEARLDLNDDEAEEFLVEMVDHETEIALSEMQWRYLFALSRKLHLIHDEYIPFD